MNKKSSNEKKVEKHYHDKIFIFIQMIVTIATLTVGIISAVNKGSLIIWFESLIALLMFIMAYNNYRIYKRDKVTIFYVLTGLVVLGIVILSILGIL